MCNFFRTVSQKVHLVNAWHRGIDLRPSLCVVTTTMHPRVVSKSTCVFVVLMTMYTVQPVRPVRIAARRQRELMAIIAFDVMEDAEWLNDDFVDLTG